MANFSPGIEDLLTPLKQRMETLEEENRVLRAQLAQTTHELENIKRGVGVTVYINGKQVASGAMIATDGAPPQMAISNPANVPSGPFAAPAVLNDRRPAPAGAPHNGAANANLFPPAGRPPAQPAANGRESQPTQRNGNYVDFFLD